MAVYVLVHGGDRDASIWDKVAHLLKKQGHQVFCPSMTSVTQSSLKQNIDEIVELIESNQLEDIILVGHSYGAFVITGVFDTLPNKISFLVFVDSAIPKSGKSLYGLLAEYGFDYKKHGLTPDKACLDELFFDEESFSATPKTYIHCLQSEFLEATKPVYNEMVSSASENNWAYFCLDTTHGCMFTQPNELAVILSGIPVLST